MQHPVRPLLTKACLLGGGLASAQCTDTFTLGNDTTLCTGQTLVLEAPLGYQSYLWDNGSTSNLRTVTGPGTYQCTATDFGTSGELVVNGDFDDGATGFTSDYVPGTGGTYGLLSFAGTYGVSTSPQALHSNFSPCGDHTTGTGNMLVVNGTQTPGQSIWCQTVTVQPNTDYAFSAWLTSAFFESPAQLQFTVNGVAIGNGLNATTQTCSWDGFYGIWPSGAATSATICITNLNTFDSGNDFALDDISFAPFCTYEDEITVSYQAYPEPDLGPDLEACADVPVVLDATWPDADAYNWQDGSNGPNLAVNESGTYWVDVTVNGCTERDSVDILVLPLPVVELGPDQERCEGEVVVLSASNTGATYLWQDGSMAADLVVNSSGNYSVMVDLDGCIASDQVDINYSPLPIVELGNDTTLCADTALVLDVTRPGGSYLWEDGSTGPVHVTSTAGTYHVTVTENGCQASDSLELGIIPLPVVDLGADFLLCTGTTAILDASGPGLSYAWTDGSDDAVLVIAGPGEYGVTVSNTCGEASDAVLVVQDFCDCPVFVPNAFSPGGDGINDGFRPVFDCPFTTYRFSIYDRWGAELWQTEDHLQAWTAEGELPGGIYTWTLEFKPETVGDKNSRRIVGHVALLR